MPDLDVLTATRLRTQELLRVCSQTTAPESDRDAFAQTQSSLDRQHTVLTSLLQAGGVDLDDEDGAAPEDSEMTRSDPAAPGGDASSATATSGPTKSDVSAVIDLLVRYSRGETARAELGSLSAINLPTLLALHGQRTASAALLGERLSWPAAKGPKGAGAITLLAGLRQAIYGLEVVAAQATGPERESYRDAISALRGPTRTMTDLAGPAAPAPPLGYGLPSDLSTPGRRQKLAQSLMTALPQAIIAGSGARAFDPAAIDGTIQLMSIAVQVGSRLGVPQDAFPGLTVPDTP